MLYIIIAILVLFAILDRVTRVSRLEIVKYDARFALFSLRDELRDGLIANKVKHTKWFDYLDTTITKSIDMLPVLNIWDVLIIGYFLSKDKRVEKAKRSLENALNQDENEFLAEIYKKFIKIIIVFLNSRHILLSMIIYNAFRLSDSWMSMKKRQENIAKIVTISPETSTLITFAT